MQRKWRRNWERGKSEYVKNQLIEKKKSIRRIPSLLAKKLLPPVVAASLLLASMSGAYANPTGGQITSGTGAIAQNGNTMTITQKTNKMSINWQGFSIGSGESVNFLQPGASAIALNRVLGNNASNIYGQLNANGKVFLINPNGVLFAPGAQVNVGGLVASALNLTDSDFQAGKYNFSGNGGSVINQGTITAANGGYVALLGGQASNQGIIVAKQGTVALGGGSAVTLDMNGDGLLSVAVNQSTLQALAENKNLIQADGGTVLMTARAADTLAGTVVNNSGIIQAHSVSNVNGVIRLEGGANGTVTNSGTLDASGKNTGETGGTVKVLGSTVSLATGGNIDVSGDGGGGTALIGGNFHGAGPEQNAQTTTLANGSTINANAITNGNGGSVAIWSDGNTNVNGSISARGGANGGNGGQVETSGHKLTIGDSARVNTLAPRGKAGNWLLDPVDFTIYDPGFGSGDMTGAQITAALNSGNVTIQTGASSVSGTGISVGAGTTGSGDINVTNGVLIGGYDWTSNTTLTLSAYRHVNVSNYACIESDGGGNVVLRADNTGKGVGTVIVDPTSTLAITGDLGTGTGKIDIYYNPYSYSSPTVYTGAGNFVGDASRLFTHMAINIKASVANKTYDGTTNATVSGVTVNGTAPDGTTVGQQVSVSTAGATAAFDDKNAGTNKAVTISDVTLSGADASLYYLNGLDSKTADINKANLSVTGITASNKTYDASTAATLSGTATVSALGSDAVSVTGSGAGTFSDKNAGNGKAVTVTGYSLTGADAGNYNIVQPTGLTANISKANLSVAGITASNKTYDATTAATLNGTATVSAFGSDVVSITGSGVGTFSDKNAGNGKAVTVTGYSLTGADAGNYNIVQPTGLTANISKANLSVAGITASNKTYDATTAATLNGTATVSAFGSDVVSVTGSGVGTFSDKNAGNGKAVIVTGYSLTGADAGNYNIVQPTGLTANINKANLSVTGITASNKTYDASTAATLSGTATVSALGSDVVSVTGSGAGTFSDKNAGNGKAVTVTGYSLTGADAGNYNIVQPTGVTADINKANLTLSGSRTYDGTTTIAGSVLTATGVNGETFTVTGTGDTSNLSNKNVQTGSTLSSVAGLSLGTSSNGGLANNYNALNKTGSSISITPKALNLGGITASNKVYDGTTTATLNTAGVSFSGLVGGDAVTLSGTGVGTFSDKNAGNGKAVTVTGYSLTGADAGNYTVGQPTGLTADINKANLSVTGITASNKTYDATTAATLNGTATVSALGSDVVSVVGSGVGTFSDKNTGNGKTVTVTGYSLTGADAGNYSIVQPTGLTANISKANLSVAGITASNKTYDATTAATLNGTATVSAFGSDVVSVTGSGVGTFSDKNAGNGKAVTVTGYSLTGADAGNYNIVLPTGLTANINKANLNVAGITASNKTYDATTAATLNGTATVSALGSDVVSVTGSGVGTFSDKNAGNGKTVTVTGYSLTGADAGNYSIVQPTGLTANINKANLSVTGITASNKTYDATTAATLNGTATVSALGSDVVSVAGSGVGTFADKNAGNGKTVTVTGYSLTGADAGNYNIVLPTGLTADINKAAITVSGISADNKVYDATTAATINTAGAILAGRLSGDTVTVSATGAFADANVGAGKTVTLSSTYGGADAGNYTFTNQASTVANITQKSLIITANNASKPYDGTPYSGGNGVSYSGFATGETSAVLGGTITYGGTSQGAVDKGTYSITVNGLTSSNYAISYQDGILTINQGTNLSQGDLYKSAVTTSTQPASKIGLGTTAFNPNTSSNAINLTIAPNINGQFNPPGTDTTQNNLTGGQAANVLTIAPPQGTAVSYTVSQAPNSIKLIPAAGSTLELPTASGPLAVYSVSNGQMQSVGMYQMNSGRDGLRLSSVEQSAPASSEIPEVPTKGTYAEIALNNGEIGRYFVGISGNTLIIRPENNGGSDYITQTDAVGNTPIVAAGMMVALQNLGINPGTIQSAYIYKN